MHTALVTLVLGSAPAYALDSNPSDSRATELAHLRREVETMSTDLLLRKEDLRNRLKAAESQRLEIEVQIRREELRLAQVETEAAARRAELQAHANVESALAPALRDAVAGLRAGVVSGLPFHVNDRLKELDSITQQLDAGLITPEAGVARLWAFTEDEIRLARENGLDRQTVPLAEGEVLADVARLGMVALYFRSDGGIVGAATQGPNGWTWKVLDDRDEVLAISSLFDKMQHGVRTGAFVLPDAGASL